MTPPSSTLPATFWIAVVTMFGAVAWTIALWERCSLVRSLSEFG
jgi:hypothetical protein